MNLTLRGREEVEAGTGIYRETTRDVEWDAKRTAIIVCDMWDRHWCVSASRRVEELAPVMDRVLRAARAQGVLIVHAPSETLAFYEGTLPRQHAQNAPTVPAPEDIRAWQRLDLACESPLPIDDSDAGCDDEPVCSSKPPYPWARQHPDLHIALEDAISDDGAEVHNLFALHTIENVIVMGVHTNMCVLGRPFGIRRLVRQKLNVALMRDMTDALYNPRRAPYVDHFTGTDLMIAHIERHWCPSLTSDQLLGGSPFRFEADTRAR